MSSDAQKRLFRSLLPLIFVSGASALIYEILWIRALGRHFGTTVPAVSAVLASFMGGLALGNAILGRRADRDAHPLLLYRRLELGIGVSGLLVSLLLLRGDPVLQVLSRATAGPLEGVLRLAIFGALLIVPTTLIGGTLPALARVLVESGASGRVAGGLYAVNTFGAVAGALVPDLILIPNLGLTATALLAALGNLVVALLVGRLPTHEAAIPVAPQVTAVEAPERDAALLYAASGFAAMGFEVLWTRILEYWTANLVSSFAVLLAVLLIALALGSAISSRLADRARRPLLVAAVLVAFTGPVLLLAQTFAPEWRALAESWLPTSGDGRAAMGRLVALAALHAAWIEGPAGLLMGATFPLLAAAVVRPGSAGRQSGRLYAANTLAGVAGSVATGLVLLPWLGVQETFIALAAFSSLCAGAIAWRSANVRWLVLTPVLVAGIALIRTPEVLRRSHFADRTATVTWIREGSVTTAGVVHKRWFGEPAYLELRTPGVSMSDTRFGSQRYMGMMAHLGLFFTEKKERALLICYGVGNTARSLLSHRDLRHLDVVDISAEVISASPEFAAAQGSDPLKDPRAETHLDDGRHHLVVTPERYDVITSEPPPPNNAGVVNLYSREFYALARARLQPGGVITQWLPVFQLSQEETLAITKSFVDEFPFTALFYGYGYQWILVGSQRPLAIDPRAWTSRAAQDGVAEDLRRIGADGAGDVAGAFLLSDRALREATEATEAVTDDWPSIQYPFRALDRVEVPEAFKPSVQDAGAMFPAATSTQAFARGFEVTRRIFEALPWSGLVAPELREVLFGSAVRRALVISPSNGVRALLRVGDDRVGLAARAVEARGARVEPEAALTLARRAFYDGRWEEARTILAGLEVEPREAAAYSLLLGGVERALGRVEEARSAFGQAAARSGSVPFKQHLQALSEAAGTPGLADPLQP